MIEKNAEFSLCFSPSAAGKNGITNLAYDHDTKPGREAGGEGKVTEGLEDPPVAATRKKRRMNKGNMESEVTKSNGSADR